MSSEAGHAGAPGGHDEVRLVSARPPTEQEPPTAELPVTRAPSRPMDAALRLQLADFAELAHRHRVPALRDQPAVGYSLGNGIAPAVVRAMATVLRSGLRPGLDLSQEHLTDVLMRGLLVVPAAATGPTPLPLSFTSSCGRIRLAVSMSPAAGPPPATQFLRTGDQSATRTAAVVCGSAAAVADGRPYLSLDALTSFARRQALRQDGHRARPHAAAQAMHTATRLEIVVLLDPARDRGIWVDVDPATGLPAAALAIDLTTLAQPGGWQATPLTEIDPARSFRR
jgi:hypothetical protein